MFEPPGHLSFLMEGFIMAYYYDPKVVRKEDQPVYELLLKPGAPVLWSGIYRCEGCGLEVVRASGDQLPGVLHRRHEPKQILEWRLIVRLEKAGEGSEWPLPPYGYERRRVIAMYPMRQRS
jgi:hypothetical protein